MEREEKIKQLIEIARSFIGYPYKYGAYAQPDNGEKPGGFDCSSFSQYVFGQVGVNLPRSSILQAASELGQEISADKIEAGDILFFEGIKGHYWHVKFPKEVYGRKIYIGHLAIYTGDGNIIHAVDNGVIECPLADILSKPNYDIILAKRFL